MLIMTRLQFLFAFGTICSQWYILAVSGKSNFNVKRQENIHDVTRYIPIKAQLEYASLAIQTNGMIQYVIKVLGADDAECFFNFPNLEVETSVNDVMKKDGVVTGILLLKRRPYWIMFNCFSPKVPVVSQYLFMWSVPHGVSTQMEFRNQSGCRMTEPFFSSDENSFIVEIQASCNFPLRLNNVKLSVDGVVLHNGNVSYYSYWDNLKTTRTYENGVAKSRLTVPKHIYQSSNNIYVPRFTLQFLENGLRGEEALRSYKHMYLSKKALDGTSPVIPRGTVAIAIHPQELETIYVPRGSKRRLTCEAYGNPKPLIEWYKSGQRVTGMKDFASLYLDKFYEYESIIIKDMDGSKDGEYSCQAHVQGTTVTKSVFIKLCDPATVTFSTSQDESNIYATLSAKHDDSNKVYDADCYKGRTATNGAWIKYYDPSVTISIRGNDTSWEKTYSWTDKGVVPKEMYCEISAKCIIYPMTFSLNV